VSTPILELLTRDEVSGLVITSDEQWAQLFHSLWNQDLYNVLKKGMLMIRFRDDYFKAHKGSKSLRRQLAFLIPPTSFIGGFIPISRGIANYLNNSVISGRAMFRR
jgi:hypothetical protein